MTPDLARFIRLARRRIHGTPLDGEAVADAERADAIEQFKLFLGRRLQLNVRFELYSGTKWDWSPDGCSLQFTIDEHTFVLQQTGPDSKLSHRIQGKIVPLVSLADDKRFEDLLLIAIDDAMKV